MVSISRFDVFLITLDPTAGYEIKKTRPCLVISPDEINRNLQTIIIAPMTTKSHPYPTRVYVNFEGKQGHIVLDQMRTVDRSRLVKKLGVISMDESHDVLETLQQLFAE